MTQMEAPHSAVEILAAQPGLGVDPLAGAHLLPCRLVLETPVIGFTVRTLMELARGAIVETAAQHNEDLMLEVNGQPVGMVKFDVTGDKLAVRLTGVA